MVYKITEILDRTIESDLILTDILREMQLAVRKNTVAFPGLVAKRFGPESIPGTTMTVKLQDADTAAFHLTGERALSVYDNETYNTLNFTPEKYTKNLMITDEMKEDSLFDLVNLDAQTTGKEAAILLDKKFMQAVETGAVANATTHVVTGASDLSIANILSGMALLEADNHKCTDLILNVDHIEDLRALDTFAEADKYGSQETMGQGFVGKIFGMNVYQTNNEYTNGSSYIIDRDYAIAFAEKRPLTLKPYEDVERGISGAVASMRFSVAYLRKEACCQIT